MIWEGYSINILSPQYYVTKLVADTCNMRCQSDSDLFLWYNHDTASLVFTYMYTCMLKLDKYLIVSSYQTCGERDTCIITTLPPHITCNHSGYITLWTQDVDTIPLSYHISPFCQWQWVIACTPGKLSYQGCIPQMFQGIKVRLQYTLVTPLCMQCNFLNSRQKVWQLHFHYTSVGVFTYICQKDTKNSIIVFCLCFFISDIKWLQ